MRGSVYYQTSILVKTIFKEGSKKTDRINPEHENYKSISSFKTMETYRRVWNNLFNYLLEHWKIKNCELITSEHIEAYIFYKLEYYPSKQYLEKIVSAINKLEFALNKYSKNKYQNPIFYDFSITKKLLSTAKYFDFISNNFKRRVYKNPQLLIKNLKYQNHRIAATIQLEGGARVEGVSLINHNQLKGLTKDKISQEIKGVIETKEKGGKVGDIFINITTYENLIKYMEEKNIQSFRVKYQKYADDIKQASLLVNEEQNGSHGFRWTFARNRVREYQQYGYSYEEALQGVSWEMKHYRASITEHYLS